MFEADLDLELWGSHFCMHECKVSIHVVWHMIGILDGELGRSMHAGTSLILRNSSSNAHIKVPDNIIETLCVYMSNAIKCMC